LAGQNEAIEKTVPHNNKRAIAAVSGWLLISKIIYQIP